MSDLQSALDMQMLKTAGKSSAVLDERRFADLKNSPRRSQTEVAAKLQPAFPTTN
jgi:hypothetical protein